MHPIQLSYLSLLGAICLEIVATTALKASDGFTRLAPSLVSIAGYVLSLYLLSLALRGIPVGVAYAIWSGLGIVFITIVAWFRFGQRLDPIGLAGITLIVAGVLVIQLFSKAGAP